MINQYLKQVASIYVIIIDLQIELMKEKEEKNKPCGSRIAKQTSGSN